MKYKKITVFHTFYFQLRGALRKAKFHMDGKNYTFDNRGDLNSGYDVVLWRQTSPDYVDVNYIVALYSIETENLTFISDKTYQDVINLTVRICLLFIYLYSMYPHSLQFTLAA